MFFRLKRNYLLRGWKGMSWALVHRPDNRVEALTQEMFQVLLLCDGQTQLPGGLLDEPMEESFRQCEAKGWLEACDKPSPLEPDQIYRYYPNRYVMKVFWSITGRCNFRCRHCYMDAPDGALGELSTAEALNLIDQMAECGVLQVDLTGGEPLVRRDFWQLVDQILSHRMVIGKIYTNGWLLDEKVLDELDRRGMRPGISISFDGTGGWHDWMRGVPGAEQAALEAFRLCVRRGFRVYAAMCVHRGNLEVLPRTIQTLGSIGAAGIKISNINQTKLWRSHSEGNALTQQEYMEAMIPYIDWYYRAGQPIRNMELSGIALMQRDRPPQLRFLRLDGTENCLNAYLCGEVRWSCYITPEGRLLPCMPMTDSPEQRRFPKVQDIGLRQGLSGSFYMKFVTNRVKDLLDVNAECAACEYRCRCGGGCRASALSGGNHDLMGCDRKMCLFWKNGYAERIRQAAEDARAKYGVQERCPADGTKNKR